MANVGTGYMYISICIWVDIYVCSFVFTFSHIYVYVFIYILYTAGVRVTGKGVCGRGKHVGVGSVRVRVGGRPAAKGFPRVGWEWA